ncbi:Predicted 3-hydroxylacyl-ACP dehydratase, HotDog domain [Arboricoccus pini]|uniref:Predicted 3-hydroxylacyl-ACP dehydratase, HotDog domain n=1 Tax=Arboricoccus pini TaxID=1963835 RepID=A0A212R4K2_9PROT|nr:hypothetical protein [Arboricoccus pini]SNB66798.1 Predicted 3-hydroxylacyl-ACP dehydratase, HotDog domain [Arboricoccus pini]
MIPLARIDRALIETLVPQKGRMCLLDGVENLTAAGIVARAPAPDAGHPLAREGGLAAVACVEIGLQAMALHGALMEESGQRPGFVSSLSDLLVARSHAGPFPFLAMADLLFRAEQGFAYRFAVRQKDDLLVAGKATIMFPDLGSLGA